MKYAHRVSNMKPSSIREMLKVTACPEIISFAGGWPAPESFPIDQIKSINEELFGIYGGSALQYSSTEGFEPLRKSIAERMTSNKVNSTKDNILITNGSQQGLDFTAKLFINPKDKIICESPSYVGALNAFRAYEPEFIDIRMDADGMNMDELENTLRNNPDAKFIYTVPDFQNPTGISMSLEKRKKLAELSNKFEIPVIEDNPYYELCFEGEKLPPVASFDKMGTVIYLGSFSKTFCPGLRIGWVMANQCVLSKYILIKQSADLQNNTLSQMVLSEFIHRYNFDDHIKSIIKIYSSRKNTMLNAMEGEFPSFVKYTNPKGGMFTWVELPKKYTSAEVFEEAIKLKVAFIPGDTFYPNGGDTNHFRLNYATMKENLINEGINRLGIILRSLC